MAFKKITMIVAMLLFFGGMVSSLYAEFLSISGGIPLARTFSEKDNGEELKTDSISGTLIHVNLPLFPGLGYESYETKIKGDSNAKLQTDMYDIFYLLPIPVVNLTIGVGAGTTKLTCNDCDSYYKNESMNTNQYYFQAGFPILPLFDIHVSYHAISGKIKSDSTSVDDLDISGTMYGIGAQFTF